MTAQIFTPTTRADARSLISTEGQQHALVVYFTKRDGTRRRMVCRYYGATSKKPHLITVWDMEKGDTRSVNLDTVDLVKVLAPATKPKPAPDREPARRRLEALKAELAEFC